MSWTGSDGLAMKKSESGMDRPGVARVALQVVPALLRCTEGTKTA